MILYTNDNGNVYDSYYLARIKFDDIQIFPYLKDGKWKMKLLNKKIEFIDTNFSTHMYSKSDSEKILKWHQRKQKKFIKDLDISF